MNSSPLVSVLIPCYNAQDYLAETLDSVISQTYRNLEVIIVDDGSTDLSRQILLDYAKKDERIQLFFQPNKGPSAARNKAFEISKGEWIQYLDADDLLNPFKIEGQLSSALECKQKDVVVYGDIYTLDQSGVIKHKNNFPNIDFYDPLDFIFYDSIHFGSTGLHLFPRHIIEANEEWEEKINIYEDLDFFCRAISKAQIVKYAQGTIFFYRIGHNKNSLTNQKKYFLSDASWYMVKKISLLLFSKIHAANIEYKRQIARFVLRWMWNVYPELPSERALALKLIDELGFSPKELNISAKSNFFLNILGLRITLFFLFFYKKIF